MKNHFFIGLFIMASFLVFAQESAVLCSTRYSSLKIENSSDIPIVSSNTDGTINLTFAQQYITDVFSSFIIYEFYQAYPNSSSDAVLKLYTVSYNSRSLIEDVLTNIPSNIIEISTLGNDTYGLPMRTTITSSLFQSLDGNTYDVTKYISTSDGGACSNAPNCELDDVPEDFNFRVNFNYNTETELLTMESESLTSCGNAFLIALTGGNPNEFGEIDNTLQTWEATPITSTISEFSQPCHNIETTIFTVLDIACYNYAYGNISVAFDSVNESFRFIRNNMVFGYDIIELSEANLSIEDRSFKFMKPFEIKGNPYLQISNLNNQSVSVEIYNTSGQHIVQAEKFEENSLDISNLSVGLYFIRISNLNNQQIIFKFLKN